MSSMIPGGGPARDLPRADDILRRSEAFFMQDGMVFDTLRRLARRFRAENIPYAIIGGMALNLWGYTRETLDIDILVTPAGLEALREHMVGRGYVPAFAGAEKTFRDAETHVKIEIITSGEYPGDGKPKPVAFPDPNTVSVDRDGYQTIRLEKLIELKLASGLTAPHRLRDLADVQDLIIALALPRDLASALDESVRVEYVRLWEAARQAPPSSE
jgi:hypothetical protein